MILQENVGKNSSSKALSELKTELLSCLPMKPFGSSSYLNFEEAVTIILQSFQNGETILIQGTFKGELRFIWIKMVR